MSTLNHFYESFRLGPLSTNCYLVWNEEREAVLIDTAGNPEVLWAEISKRDLRLHFIVNTHGHYDHIACNVKLAELSGARILIHEADASYLTDNDLNLAGHFAPNYLGRAADGTLREEELIRMGDLCFQVLHTPGHTPGSVCLLSDDLLFSGDTLFAGSVGRSDLIGGDGEVLLRTLREKLNPLSDQLKVLPGHGAATTMGKEKQDNPWMLRADSL